MWARLDDELLDHPKLFAAGARLGPDGLAIAMGVYTLGLLWSNRQLSDGHLPVEVVKRFPYVRNPLAVADALVHAGLWEKNGQSFTIHDFGEYNPLAADIKAKRRRERLRKQRERREKVGSA